MSVTAASRTGLIASALHRWPFRGKAATSALRKNLPFPRKRQVDLRLLDRKEITAVRNLLSVGYALSQAAAIALAATVAPAAALAADTSPLPPPVFTVSRSFPLGGAGGWDYLALEASGARLFISRDDRLDVVETVSGKLAGTIPNTPGVHGIAFAPALKRGFTSNGRSDTVSVFELDTLRLIQEVQVSGKKPDAILYEPRQNHIITANGESANLSALDASTLQIVATVALPGPPEFMVSDPAGTVYVNIETDPGKLVAVDGKSLTVKATWPLPGCATPTGLALDAVHHRLFSVCQNQVMAVTDAQSGKQVARVVIGRGPDAVAFDPDLSLVFSSNGLDGTLTVIQQESPDEYRVLASVTTQVSARTMVLDPATHKIYLAAAQLGATPPATDEQPHPRPSLVPNSFGILVAQPK
jgi:DNA-binding beta-propeller fold protein YncE